LSYEDMNRILETHTHSGNPVSWQSGDGAYSYTGDE
jgi:hypothetical protein